MCLFHFCLQNTQKNSIESLLVDNSLKGRWTIKRKKILLIITIEIYYRTRTSTNQRKIRVQKEMSISRSIFAQIKIHSPPRVVYEIVVCYCGANCSRIMHALEIWFWGRMNSKRGLQFYKTWSEVSQYIEQTLLMIFLQLCLRCKYQFLIRITYEETHQPRT